MIHIDSLAKTNPLVCSTFGQRIKSAVMYSVLTSVVFVIMFVIVYIIGGYVEYDTELLNSGMIPLENLGELGLTCLEPAAGGNATVTYKFFESAAQSCSAFATPAPQSVEWRVRTTFLVYVIAVASILGWLLLMVFGGVGIIALPLDMIMRCVPVLLFS